MTQFERYVRKWQKLLHLEHWTITVVSSKKSSKAIGLNGQMQHAADTRRATITHFRNPDMPIEETALHELLHVMLADMDYAVGRTTYDGLVEIMIEHLTRALVDMDGRPRKK